MPATTSGRRGQAARNDPVILNAARAVFLVDPKAPVAAVAERAGVGMSALYRRYVNKEDLLRQLCHEGLRHYLGLAEMAGAEPDGWTALVTFLRAVVAADVHSLTVRLAGTFEPSAELRADAVRANALTAELVERAHASGRLRASVVAQDIGLILEGCAAIRAGTAERTAELRQRHLALLIDGLGAPDSPLPGPAPTADDFRHRWNRVPAEDLAGTDGREGRQARPNSAGATAAGRARRGARKQ